LFLHIPFRCPHTWNNRGMKVSYLYKGLPGHPIHPPLTDATIGTYTSRPRSRSPT